MNNFTLHTPTKILFGQVQIAQLREQPLTLAAVCARNRHEVAHRAVRRHRARAHARLRRHREPVDQPEPMRDPALRAAQPARQLVQR